MELPHLLLLGTLHRNEPQYLSQLLRLAYTFLPERDDDSDEDTIMALDLNDISTTSFDIRSSKRLVEASLLRAAF